MNETFAFEKNAVIMSRIRGVAQPGRVLGLGPRCRRFEPSHPDHKIQPATTVVGLIFRLYDIAEKF